MKAIYLCFSQMLQQLKHDIMLLTISIVPFLIGAVFRFVIPAAEHVLTGYLGKEAILASYYNLFDLLLIILTPYMLDFVVAMVILEETDDHMTAYLAVTPLGKAGYLLSRLGAAGVISFPVSIIVSLLFHLTQINILMLMGIALAAAVHGVVVALLIVALSTNKVEGMAVGKMAGLCSLGALIPYFITGKAQYFLSFLPSFWMAKSMQANSYVTLLISILLAVLWMIVLSKKFIKKMA